MGRRRDEMETVTHTRRLVSVTRSALRLTDNHRLHCPFHYSGSERTHVSVEAHHSACKCSAISIPLAGERTLSLLWRARRFSASPGATWWARAMIRGGGEVRVSRIRSHRGSYTVTDDGIRPAARRNQACCQANLRNKAIKQVW